VEGSATSEAEKETAHRVTAMAEGAVTILGTFPRTSWRKMMVIRLGGTGALGGRCLGQAALRREQQEQLKSKQHENRATGGKMRPITDVTSTALRGEEVVVCM
jgi:hypothetical protein